MPHAKTPEGDMTATQLMQYYTSMFSGKNLLLTAPN